MPDAARAKTSGFLFLRKPELSEASDLLQTSLRRREFVVIGGCCQCKYYGRASSTLDWGERIIIIKEDGSVQVHRPIGYEPVNWQPPRCTLSAYEEDSSLIIKAHRPDPRETLEMKFNKLLFIASLKLTDRAEFNLYVSEEQMRDALISDPEILEEGLRVIDFEKKIEPGFIDFYGKDAQERTVVIELKRSPAGKDAILQLKKYVDVVNEIAGLDVRGVVVAPGLRSGAQRMLTALGLEFKRLTPQKCAQIIKKKETRKISEFFSSP